MLASCGTDVGVTAVMPPASVRFVTRSRLRLPTSLSTGRGSRGTSLLRRSDTCVDQYTDAWLECCHFTADGCCVRLSRVLAISPGAIPWMSAASWSPSRTRPPWGRGTGDPRVSGGDDVSGFEAVVVGVSKLTAMR